MEGLSLNQTSPNIVDFGRQIALLREKTGFTQLELAEKINVSDKVISKWECGETKPSIDIIPALADAFNISIDDLFGRIHDCTNDICASARDYIYSTEPYEAFDNIQKILSYMVLGAQIRQNEDMGCYTPMVAAEIAAEMQKAIEEGGSRPQIFCEDIEAHYSLENIINISNNRLKFAVIQQYSPYSFKNLFDSYDLYRPLFVFLAMPGADKLLIKAYAEEIPNYVTVDYVANLTETPTETVTAFLELVRAEKLIAVIKGKEVPLNHWEWWTLSTCFSAVLGAAYLIRENWR